jgi:hypothetical protein
MNKPRIVTGCCFLLYLWASLVPVPSACAEEEKTPSDLSRELKEMPVLTGQEWQTLQPETKIAFIWGIGHVVTRRGY